MQAIILGILKSLITERLLKALAAEVIESIVEATDNKVDNEIARPIIEELRR